MHRALLLLDPLAVLAFVAIGRDTHAEDPGFAGVAGTAAPFLLAVVAGWVVARAWRDPLAFGIGAGVAATTVGGGMLLRRLVFGDGTAAAFIAVAAGFLGLAMLGWRLLATQWVPRRDG